MQASMSALESEPCPVKGLFISWYWLKTGWSYVYKILHLPDLATSSVLQHNMVDGELWKIPWRSLKKSSSSPGVGVFFGISPTKSLKMLLLSGRGGGGVVGVLKGAFWKMCDQPGKNSSSCSHLLNRGHLISIAGTIIMAIARANI